MAKDGTVRGGARQGAGRKKKPISEKIIEGNPGRDPLTIIDFGDRAAELEGADMPKPSDFLSEKQSELNGSQLVANEIYEKTWNWLSDRNCVSLVSPQLIERYSMASARWIQCEKLISETGFLGKHPTTGEATQSPYVAISDKYMSQANRLWSEIFQIVRENCTSEYKGATPQDDVMENLLRSRKG